MIECIVKRDGRNEEFDPNKIEDAIYKAAKAVGGDDRLMAKRLALKVMECLDGESSLTPTVEHIQDIVERTLIKEGHAKTAKAYILYRERRNNVREMQGRLMKVYDEISNTDADECDLKRENANIDGNTAMGTMLRFGSEGAKEYFSKYILTPEQVAAHGKGDIHIHDFDFYTLTMTCCQIDIIKLFTNGFCTGHGYLREPNDIRSYSALAAVAIQANQNDQHGGQSVPNLDYGLALGVIKTYAKIYISNFCKACELTKEESSGEVKNILSALKADGTHARLQQDERYDAIERDAIGALLTDEEYSTCKHFAVKTSADETDKATNQAMEALVHNLNTMHSRAGAQVPFSSVNFGTDTSAEGRMVSKNMLLAIDAGLGNGETAIFPVSIFKVKEGVNYNIGDPNYDLFKLACRVSAKRLFPNFAFIDAPYNLQYYKPNRPETEVAYMGCRTRVMGNVYDPDREISYGRGNISFSSINLPRIAINSNGNMTAFYAELKDKMALVCRQLLDRMSIIAKKKINNFPFLMGQGVWIDSEKLGSQDNISEIMKQGSLSIGFIGLAETLISLTGRHHGESAESQELGLQIVGFMRKYLDDIAAETKLNFTLLATPAEGLSGRFVKIDKKLHGVIKGVTDKDFYTNGFHVPVYYNTCAAKKIDIEAPYHALCNAGHITYVELDGDTANNVEAFEKIIRYMKDAGIGYGSINHPVDRDPVCGYNGVIGDKCPKCGRSDNDGGLKFERIRRITGYLVGTVDRFNNAKRAEERARVKHNV